MSSIVEINDTNKKRFINISSSFHKSEEDEDRKSVINPNSNSDNTIYQNYLPNICNYTNHLPYYYHSANYPYNINNSFAPENCGVHYPYYSQFMYSQGNSYTNFWRQSDSNYNNYNYNYCPTVTSSVFGPTDLSSSVPKNRYNNTNRSLKFEFECSRDGNKEIYKSDHQNNDHFDRYPDLNTNHMTESVQDQVKRNKSSTEISKCDKKIRKKKEKNVGRFNFINSKNKKVII